jgi:hypothetical protein
MLTDLIETEKRKERKKYVLQLFKAMGGFSPAQLWRGVVVGDSLAVAEMMSPHPTNSHNLLAWGQGMGHTLICGVKRARERGGGVA